ncbi:MAG: Nif3-like dinuclear metal center hexameric protein [Kofleriaceae bacterium]|nr:Nif3-like dinuclear metal center hexameric protein [Kofleriaceae bacterium]
MKLQDVQAVLETVAPSELAADWDEVGLHLAGNGKRIRRAMLCIDLTPDVLEEAIAAKCQLLVVYHPPIFRPLGRLADRDWKEVMVARAIRAGIAVYSPHSALDAAADGMNDWLCEGLGKHSARSPIVRAEKHGSTCCKVIVYVPVDAAEKLRNVMWKAGAGGIGQYDQCSFNLVGQGTFRGGEGANPAIGVPGRLEKVEEIRVEMICRAEILPELLREIREAHPYEEAAIDVIALQSEATSEEGAGRYHVLETPVTVATLVRRLKRHLGLKKLKVALPRGKEDLQISSVAVCVGAGGSLFENYWQADAYVTGEMQHHQILDMTLRGKVVILAGHTNSERPFLGRYRESIIAAGGEKVEWLVSERDCAPIEIV